MSIPPHNDDDPWQLPSPQAVAQKPVLQVEVIESIEPLDTQLGVFPKKTVPDALHGAMFGQPDPSPAEIEAAGGDPAAVSPMRTYAILDAAKVTNLPELLETSGLEHRCLFKGDAYDELRDVAPWIVQLDDDNGFTRNLFTRSDAPWHLWDTEPGIYVRSRGTLDEMWRHLRKFTRASDERGRWHYLRFWDPQTATDTFMAFMDDGLSGMFKNNNSIILPNRQGVEILTARGDQAKTMALSLTQRGKRDYLQRRQMRLSSLIASHFLSMPEFNGLDKECVFNRVDYLIDEGRRIGLIEGADLFKFTLGFFISDDPRKLLIDIERINSDDALHMIERQRKIMAAITYLIDRANNIIINDSDVAEGLK